MKRRFVEFFAGKATLTEGVKENGADVVDPEDVVSGGLGVCSAPWCRSCQGSPSPTILHWPPACATFSRVRSRCAATRVRPVADPEWIVDAQGLLPQDVVAPSMLVNVTAGVGRVGAPGDSAPHLEDWPSAGSPDSVGSSSRVCGAVYRKTTTRPRTPAWQPALREQQRAHRGGRRSPRPRPRPRRPQGGSG